MTQYVLQIRDLDGFLAKCFTVTSSEPIPQVIPAGRTQVVMTNTASYDEIVADYAIYTTQLVFSYASGPNQISCTGPISKTWDVD